MHKVIVFFIILSILFVGCNSEDFEEHELGENLIDNSTIVSMVDTFTIKSSTVIMDSLLTSGHISVGRYIDPFLGEVKATTYAKVDLGGEFKLTKADDAKFDSVVLVAYSTGSFWGDTTKYQTIKIHEIKDEVDFFGDNNAFYNVNSFDIIDSISLGELTFKARPKRKEVSGEATSPFHDFRIKLSDKFGQDLLKEAASSEGLTSQKWDETYLKGIALIPGEEDDASVLNFQPDSINIRLYYRKTGSDEGGSIQNHRDFKVNGAYAFTNYTSDRTGTIIENLLEHEIDLPSEQSNNLSFIQGGVGIYNKLEIPYLENINLQGDAASLLKAELLLYPKEGTDSKDLYPLNGLAFEIYVTDRKNRLLAPLLNSSNNSITSIYSANDESPENTALVFDLTAYVSQVLMNGAEDDEALAIKLTGDLNNFVNRMVIDNDPESDLRIKLRTTYAVQK